MKSLVIPPAAQRDDDSIQMLSAWIAEQGLHCSINVGMWQDNGRNEAPAWGILLADTVRHIARALEEQYGKNSTDTIAAILKSLNDELVDPTSKMQGEFHHGHS
jgi:Domain of unknown function (DUF5076)